ncbi:MAG: hypothetical protein AAF721_30410 [Myxococcota bacterium]
MSTPILPRTVLLASWLPLVMLATPGCDRIECTFDSQVIETDEALDEDPSLTIDTLLEDYAAVEAEVAVFWDHSVTLGPRSSLVDVGATLSPSHGSADVQVAFEGLTPDSARRIEVSDACGAGGLTFGTTATLVFDGEVVLEDPDATVLASPHDRLWLNASFDLDSLAPHLEIAVPDEAWTWRLQLGADLVDPGVARSVALRLAGWEGEAQARADVVVPIATSDYRSPFRTDAARRDD